MNNLKVWERDQMGGREIDFGSMTTHGQGGDGRGRDVSPLEIKNKSPPLKKKNGYPSHEKVHTLFCDVPKLDQNQPPQLSKKCSV